MAVANTGRTRQGERQVRVWLGVLRGLPLKRRPVPPIRESQMEAELRAFLPRITPPGFESAPGDLVIPEKALTG